MKPEDLYTLTFDNFMSNIESLQDSDVDIENLLLSTMGVNYSSANLNEILRKCVFDGNQFDDYTKNKIFKELLNLTYRLGVICNTINISLEELMELVNDGRGE